MDLQLTDFTTKKTQQIIYSDLYRGSTKMYYQILDHELYAQLKPLGCLLWAPTDASHSGSSK